MRIDNKTNRFLVARVSAAVLGLCLLFAGKMAVADDEGSILNKFHTISTVASTVPPNGDVNPYGIALVKTTTGRLIQGHILISNFNDKANLQGTGTTIVDVAPNGAMDVFAQIDAKSLPGACPGGVGLTTALAVLKTGWVIVGSLPTKDGTAATAKAGCLIVLNNEGKAVETFYGSLINGPWDMTSIDTGDGAKLFVTNVLNGTVAAKGAVVHGGTVLRINVKASATMMPWIESMTVVGSGFAERSDPAALVIGPTGVGLSPLCAEADDDDCTVESQEVERVLYVADSLNNRVAVIPNALTRTDTAGTGATVSKGGSLNDPLGLTVAPNGHILVVNGNDGFAVEIEPRGGQVARKLLDNTGTPAGAGTLFGLIFDPTRGIFFVDDGTNTLNELH